MPKTPPSLWARAAGGALLRHRRYATTCSAMAELILVRHGQARAFEADYDRLSETGHRQARLLGDYWVRTRQPVDAVVTGSLRRHQETEAGVRAAFEAAGRTLPPAEIDPGWDEYDGDGLVARLGPVLAARDPAYRALAEQALAATGPDRNRHFQRAFEVLTAVWVEGQLSADGVEPFAEFHARAAGARARLLARQNAGRVIVFTSGGPIGVNVQMTLQAPKGQALRINSRVRNGSLTHFLFSNGRVSFDGFNIVPHLAHDAALVTFR